MSSDGDNGPVLVPREILDGLEAVRRSGLVNMLDAPRVAEVARELGHPGVAAWLAENRSLYARGVFSGFRTTE